MNTSKKYPEQDTQTKKSQSNMPVIFTLSLIIALIMVIFTLQNADAIDIKFLFWNIHGSLALILLLVFIAGSVASLLMSLSAILKRNKTIAQKDKKIKELEKNQLPEQSGASLPQNNMNPDTDSPKENF